MEELDKVTAAFNISALVDDYSKKNSIWASEWIVGRCLGININESPLFLGA